MEVGVIGDIGSQRVESFFRLHFGDDAGIWGWGLPGFGLRFKDCFKAWGCEVSHRGFRTKATT